jgi:hypothetical protein
MDNARPWPFVAHPIAMAQAAIVPRAGAGPPGTEQRLLDEVERAVRVQATRLVLVLRLSRLRPPGPRPHHRRVARAILADAAQRTEGDVFCLRNGDLVLVCRAPSAAEADAAGLPQDLARLLHSDAPLAADLVTLWSLPGDAVALIEYASARAAEAVVEADTVEEVPTTPRLVDAFTNLLADPRITDLMQRQSGVLLDQPRGRLVPLFSEVAFSVALLEERLGQPGQAAADPYLFRHLARLLDRRMLTLLDAELGTGGPLDAARPGAPPLHLNLSVPTLLDDRFARFAALCRRRGHPLGVEVALTEAAGDPAMLGQARLVLQAAGCIFALDGVSHLALLLARPGSLRPDILKLSWSPRLPDLTDADRTRLDEALDEIGRDRVVLNRADDEAAVRWGVAAGLRRFQGRHVDAMLAASRLSACPAGGGCTLRQCSERACATAAAGRRFCAEPALLDTGSPDTSGLAAASGVAA